MLIERDPLVAALPGYDVGPELGRGTYGVVYAGRHRRVGGDVAIKMLTRVNRTDRGLRARFLESGRLVSVLDHPHIARVHDYIERDGVYALVTERLVGGTLRQRERDRITPAVACAIGLAMAGALDIAHARNLPHLDMKPANVMFTAEGAPKVTDFGLATLVDGTKTQTGRFGTPSYLAPEQINGTMSGPSADLYALGVVLYEIFTGRPPFGRNLSTIALLHSHLALPPAPMDDIPAPFAAVIGQLLNKSPQARLPSARAVALALAVSSAQVLGPDWLTRVDLPVWLDDEVRAAVGGRSVPPTARRGAAAPAAGHPGPGPGPFRVPPVPTGVIGADLNGHGGSAADRVDADRRLVPGPGRTDDHGSGATGPDIDADAGRDTAPRTGPAPDLGTGVGTGVGTEGRTGGGSDPSGGSGPVGTGSTAGGDPDADGDGDGGIGIGIGPGSGAAALDDLEARPEVDDPLYRARPGRRRRFYLAGGAIVAAMIVGAVLAVLIGRPGSAGPKRSAAANRQLAADPPPASAVPTGPPAPGAYSGTPLRIASLEAYVLGIDRADNLYLNLGESRIVMVTPTGRILTLTGGPSMGYSGDGGPANRATIAAPAGIAFDPTAGTIYLSDSGNNRIRKIVGGVISTVAGTGTNGDAGDGGPAARAQLSAPAGIAFDPGTRRLYIAEDSGRRIRVVDPDGRIRTLAGPTVLTGPKGVAVDRAGDVFVADPDAARVLRITPSGSITTVAGTGTPGFSGDGGPATRATLFRPVAVDVAADGTLDIADRDNNRLRTVAPNGTISTIAGPGDPGAGDSDGDGGPATKATLSIPNDVLTDSAGNRYIADYGDNAIRRISRAGVITTVISRD